MNRKAGRKEKRYKGGLVVGPVDGKAWDGDMHVAIPCMQPRAHEVKLVLYPSGHQCSCVCSNTCTIGFIRLWW